MKKIILLLTIVLLSFTACDMVEVEDEPNSAALKVTMKQLPQLPDSLEYAVWLTYINNQNFVSEFVSKVEPDAAGNFSGSYSTIPVKDDTVYVENDITQSLYLAQNIMITVQRKTASVPAAMNTNAIIAMANFAPNRAAPLAPFAETDDFYASYNLLTPTDGDSDNNELSGIWFADSVGREDGALQGLYFYGLPKVQLTEYTTNWVYEGWVNIDGNWVSTGQFTQMTGSDLANLYGGGSAGLGYPGQDFLQNAPDGLTFPVSLAGKEVKITLENPILEFDGPSYLTVAGGTIPSDASSKVTYELEIKTDVMPTGSAVIEINY